jgi:phosphopentomutase
VNGPTLFNVAHDAGLSTMMVVGKLKLEYLVLPNSVDQFIGSDVTDMEVKNRAVGLIQAGLPAVLFIHFPDVDKAGHSTGWMSPGQMQTVTAADGLISQLVVALEGGGYLNSTLLIVTADHGGHDTTHGSDSPEDTTIPWLAVGPGVPAGVLLTSHITTYDTAATALYALNLPIPEGWDGQPVMEIFN